MSAPPKTIAEVVGTNFKRRRLQSGTTLDGVAQVARSLGFRWTASVVSDIEAGRRAATLATLVGLVAVMSLDEEPVTVADLLEGDGSVFVNKTTTVQLSALRSTLRGGAFDRESLLRVDGRPADRPLNELTDFVSDEGKGPFTLADQRAARALDRSDSDLLLASLEAWGRTLSAERDARAGLGASPQKLGRVTRTLLDELRAHWADGDD